jgi:hypothetical protein
MAVPRLKAEVAIEITLATVLSNLYPSVPRVLGDSRAPDRAAAEKTAGLSVSSFLGFGHTDRCAVQ